MLTVQALQVVSPFAVGFILLASSLAGRFHINNFVLFEFFTEIVALDIPMAMENVSILGKGYCGQRDDWGDLQL